ncbi:MAG: DUF1858 domain-containing protein [Clostridia bacterium]|nr:DUF1858 domain-containing protein [Clostridia bacterium]
MANITKETTLGEILKTYSNAQDVLKGFGMHCFSCPMSQMETVEEAGLVHGLNVDEMIEKMNADLIENKKEEKTKRCCCKSKK